MSALEFLGPAVVTTLCLGWSRPGWIALGVGFALVGLLVPPAARLAERQATLVSARVADQRP
ncbi:hypothetical protein ACNF49_40510 [Actinomadura sp. ATCC 39365]|uniref:hypothetical protein n=1 Tax=Nonomuraea sp. NPDC005692 TaxID=3157168 RepID=UPI0033C80683